MHAGHHGGSAVLLDDGRVLVAGGSGKVGQESSVEIFDPRKSTWVKTKPMAVGRSGFSLEKLPDGRLLAAGGIDWDAEKILSIAEIFDPDTETWSRVEDLPSPRYGHMSARLGDRVVVFGGSDSNRPPLTTSAVFDVSAKSWKAGPAKSGALNSAKLQMSNGQILVCGGSNATGETKFPSAAILDPRTNVWIPTGSMAQHRSLHTLTELSDGRVLAAGGSSSRHNFLTSAEIWNPNTGKWTAAEPMAHARQHHRAVLLRSGEVLVVGGYSYKPVIQAMDSCEIFHAPQ
jgi:N-acetylneuraminic acid mutarotase